MPYVKLLRDVLADQEDRMGRTLDVNAADLNLAHNRKRYGHKVAAFRVEASITVRVSRLVLGQGRCVNNAAAGVGTVSDGTRWGGNSSPVI